MPNRRPHDAPPSASPNPPKPRAKSVVLVIRMTPEDRALVEAAAAGHELETSTWARQTLVLAAKRWRAHGGASAAPPGDPPEGRDPGSDRARDAR